MSSTAWLNKAQQGSFALAACNANSLEQVQAIVQAAQSESTPMIIQISRRAAFYLGHGNVGLGLRYAAAIGKIAATVVEVPVMLHFDHGKADEVLLAAELGFTSVMFDGADLPLEENIRTTQQICWKLHAEGIGDELSLKYDLIMVVTLGSQGALAGSEGRTWLAIPPKIDAVSPVDSGDSSLAAWALAILDNKPITECLKSGIAAGTANALDLGAGHFHLPNYQKLLVETIIS